MRWLHCTPVWIWRSSIKSLGFLLKPLLALALSAPLCWLAWLIWIDVQNPGAGLGPDAGETLVHYLGEWSIRSLLVAFAVSPLRHWTGSSAWLRSRRMVGLFAFAYVCLHVSCYVAWYLGFDVSALLEDVVERPYITMGMLAFAALLPMAVTSTRGWQRRLRRNWQRLHRLIYVALAAGLLHLWWLTRDGFAEVAVYTLCFLLLCAERLWRQRQSRAASAA